MIRWTADCHGNLEEVGPKWTALTGQKIQDARNMGWLDVVADDDRDAVERDYARAIMAKRGISLTYRLRTRTGECLPVCAGAVPSFGPPACNFLGYHGSLVRIPTTGPNPRANDPAYLDWELADAIWHARLLAERRGSPDAIGALDLALLTTRWGRASHDRHH